MTPSKIEGGDYLGDAAIFEILTMIARKSEEITEELTKMHEAGNLHAMEFLRGGPDIIAMYGDDEWLEGFMISPEDAWSTIERIKFTKEPIEQGPVFP